MTSDTSAAAPLPERAHTSRAFRFCTGLLAALAVLMATSAVPQLALPLPWQWVAASAAALLVVLWSDALLAATIVALPAIIFAGGVAGLLSH